MNNKFLEQNEIDMLVQNNSNTQSDLSEIEKDTLAEIGNISMGSAATALSTLINRKVTITVPDVSLETFEQVRNSYPIPCIIVHVEYKTGLKGSNILVIKEKDAAIIANLMMGKDESALTESIDEIGLSAITEAMNMMMGSAATAMSDLFNYEIQISPPDTEQYHLGEIGSDVVKFDSPLTTISFRLEIPELVDSTMLQIIDTEFAKQMVSQLITISELDSNEQVSTTTEPADIEVESTTDPAPVTTWDDLKQDHLINDDALDDKQVDLGNLNVELIKDIPVQVRAILGKTRMSIENILKLGPGHIMELDSLDGEPIDVYANETMIAKGEVVVVGDQFGIRITEISTPKNRIKSIG